MHKKDIQQVDPINLYKIQAMICEMGGKWSYSCYFVVVLPEFVQNSMQYPCIVSF